MSETIHSRHADDHPTADTLPKLAPGNEWKFDPELREWEIVTTADHPQHGEHPLPDLPNPAVRHAVSNTYNPLPAKVKKAKTAKLVADILTVTIDLDDESRAIFGAVEHWDVVLIPRQGAPQ